MSFNSFSYFLYHSTVADIPSSMFVIGSQFNIDFDNSRLGKTISTSLIALSLFTMMAFLLSFFSIRFITWFRDHVSFEPKLKIPESLWIKSLFNPEIISEINVKDLFCSPSP